MTLFGAFLSMQLTRLSVRVEDLDSKTEMNAYNARRNSFYSGTIHTPGNMSPSLKSPGLFPKLSRRSSSPPKNTSMDNLIAAHLTANSSSQTQSAAPVIEEPKLGLWAVVPAVVPERVSGPCRESRTPSSCSISPAAAGRCCRRRGIDCCRWQVKAR